MNAQNIIEKSLLEKALLKFETQRLEKYNGLEEMSPSDETDSKIKKLIKMQNKPYYALINTASKRVACIIAVTLVTLTATALSVKAIREPLFDFFIETFDNFGIVRFENTDNNSDFISDFREPEYLPEGFKKIHTEITTDAYYVTYKNGDNIIIYEQLAQNSMGLYVNSPENREQIKVNDFDGIFYQNLDGNNIIFSDGEYSYLIYGDTSKQELIKICEKIK